MPSTVLVTSSSSGFWKTHFTYGASASDVAIHTPAGGKTVYVEGLIITPTAAGALLKIYDNSNADANAIYVGQPPLGSIVITPARPIPLSAANNVLRYATGSAAAGDVVAGITITHPDRLNSVEARLLKALDGDGTETEQAQA